MTTKVKILVAEDDPNSLDFLVALLSQAGYEVMAARDGEQALDLAKAERPV